MPLTKEQFQKAREAGYTVEQIAGFEQKRSANQKPMFSSEQEGRTSSANLATQQKQLESNASPMGVAKTAIGQTAKDVVGGAYTAANTASVGGLDAIMGLISGKSQLSQPGSAGYDVAQGAGTAVGMLVPGMAVTKSAQTASKAIKFESELQQASKAKQALDGVRSTLGQAKGIAIAEVANVPTEVSWSLKSQRAFNAIKNPVYGIDFEPGTKMPIQTVGNMDKVKEALRDVANFLEEKIFVSWSVAFFCKLFKKEAAASSKSAFERMSFASLTLL